MNCQNCGAPMRFDHERICFSCEYCTSIYFPEESRDGIRISEVEDELSCPVCNLPLILAYVENTRLSHCTKCQGVLVRQPDFLLVIEAIRSKTKALLNTTPPFRTKDLERRIYCPKCRKQMDTHPYGGAGNVVIDNCPRCMLIWLDYEELYRITHSPDRTASDRPVDLGKLFGSKNRFKNRD